MFGNECFKDTCFPILVTMKPIIVLFSIGVVGVMASLVFIYVKHNEKIKLFETVSKLDTEYQAMKFEINEQIADISVIQNDMETAMKQAHDLTTELEEIRVSNKLKKDQLEACHREEVRSRLYWGPLDMFA